MPAYSEKEGNFDGLFSYNRNDEKDYEAGKGYKSPNGGKTVPYSALDKRSYLAKIGTTFGDGDHRIVLSHMKDQHRGIRTVREEFTIFESDPAKTGRNPHTVKLPNPTPTWSTRVKTWALSKN